MPYSRGNTPLPEIAGGAPPTPPARRSLLLRWRRAAAQRTPRRPRPSRRIVSSVDGCARQKTSGGEQSQLRLPALHAGRCHPTIASGRGARARFRSDRRAGRISRAVQQSALQFLHGSAAYPFGHPRRGLRPYLSRVIYNVKRNWYSVMPVSAQMGEKGRVAIVFEILRDGSVPQIELVGSSGLRAIGYGCALLHQALQPISAIAGRVHRPTSGAAVLFPLQHRDWPLKQNAQSVKLSR